MFVLHPEIRLDGTLTSSLSVIVQTGLVTSIVIMVEFTLWIITVRLHVHLSLVDCSITASHTGLYHVRHF